jgi:flagellar motor switch protein FliG
VVRRAFDGVKPPPEPDEVLGPVSQADPEALAMVLAREQAQTVALVLSAIDPDRSAQVMEHLPETMRPAILRRMATVESVAPEVLREVGQALSQELRALVAGGMRAVDGKAVALRILRQTPSTEQGAIVEEIERDDPSLAEELRSRLFTFDDLLDIGDRDVQTLLRELDMSQLTVALRGATLEIKDKFLRNMSSRAAQMLSDDLAAMGPVRLATVEAAQAEVVRTALELTRSGQITVIRPADKVL